MKKNESLLAKAIADANELKKVSIENAKAILNEQFDEKLKNMFDEKLSEEAEESEEETEEELDEKKKPEAEEAEKEEDMDETIDIDAILAEMGDDTELDEKKKPEAEEESEEEEEEAEEDLDEEINIDQLLSEFSNDLDEKAGEEEDEEELDEAGDPKQIAKAALDKLISGLKLPVDAAKKLHNEILPKLAKAVIDGSDSAKTGLPMSEEANLDEAGDAKQMAKAALDKLISGLKLPVDVAKKLHNELLPKLAKAVIDGSDSSKTGLPMSEDVSDLLETLNSVNTLNAKLMYFTKLVNEVDLSKNEKAKILNVFDKTGSKKEAELVYNTLKEAYATKKVKDTKKIVKESLGASSSKITGSTKKEEQIVENEQFTRMQKLAGLLNG